MRVEVPLRWGDLDAQGHVNNARYIDYVQDARADFLYALKIDDLLHEGFAVVSNQIEYRAPVFFSHEPLGAEVSVAEVSEDSVTLACQLFQEDREVAIARTTLSGFDVRSHSRRALPTAAHDVFRSLVEPAESLREIEWMDMDSGAKVSQMRVRWSDLDAYGHVNNAMIFDYVQEGRITFTAAPLRGVEDSGETDYLWFLARQDVLYHHPIVFRMEPYVVRTGIARMGNSSVTFSSQVDDPTTGTVCATAAAVAVFADAAGKPTPLTDQLREDLGVYTLGVS
ncbi:MAG: thioesterase family protein [Propionibacteriaceae bacterium]|nr:thioesterase family protein [Propionibacteriaceae bacterium]